jgi:threonine/homoserine/homoserine lactone efflux protein
MRVLDGLPPLGQTLAAFIVFNIVTSITPGPNNVMLAASGAQVGFRRSAAMMLGVLVGASLILLLNLLGFGALIAAAPQTRAALRVLGCTYLLWLAWKIWTAPPPSPDRHARLFGFGATFLLQFVNPKLWLVAASAAAAFLPQGGQWWGTAALFTAVYALTIVPSILLWVGAGALMRRVLTNERRRRMFNGAMAAATVATAASLLLA